MPTVRSRIVKPRSIVSQGIFTPLNVSPHLWLDAATDTANLNTWQDKINSITFNRNGTCSLSSFGSFTARQFNKSGYYIGSYSLRNLSKLTIFVVGNETNVTISGNGFVSSIYTGQWTNDILLGSASNALFAQVNNGQDGNISTAKPNLFSGCLLLQFDGSQPSANRLQLRVNGNVPSQSLDAGFTPPTTTSSTMAQEIIVGSYVNSDWFLEGKIAHIIIKKDVLTLAEIQKLEGWAYWQSNKAFTLDSSHPYFNISP